MTKVRDNVLLKVAEAAAEKGVMEVVLREGKAKDLFNPEKISITGVITAPSEFLKKRKEVVDKARLKTHITFSKIERWIKLIVEETKHFHTIIKGELKINPELAEFGINNSSKKWTTKDLAQFLKMRKAYFVEREKVISLITNLTKFKADVQQKIEMANDDRGNTVDNYATTLKTELQLDFALKMRVFKGQTEHKFKVDICCDVRDKQITIWLESEELRMLEIENGEKLIDSEVAKFGDYVCIEV